MPLPFQMRLSDAQVAAIDAATRITDPRTGLTIVASRQDVVSSVLDAWIAQHATSAPARTALIEETVQAIADSAGLPDPAVEALTPETPPVPTPAAPADLLPPDALIEAKGGNLDKGALANYIRRLRQTMSHGKIAAHFNAEGIPTVGGKPGAQWSNSAVARLERYGLQEA